MSHNNSQSWLSRWALPVAAVAAALCLLLTSSGCGPAEDCPPECIPLPTASGFMLHCDPESGCPDDGEEDPPTGAALPTSIIRCLGPVGQAIAEHVIETYPDASRYVVCTITYENGTWSRIYTYRYGETGYFDANCIIDTPNGAWMMQLTQGLQDGVIIDLSTGLASLILCAAL